MGNEINGTKQRVYYQLLWTRKEKKKKIKSLFSVQWFNTCYFTFLLVFDKQNGSDSYWKRFRLSVVINHKCNKIFYCKLKEKQYMKTAENINWQQIPFILFLW